MSCTFSPRFAWILITVVAVGCAGSNLPEGARPTTPVTVTVTYKGAPVEGATVTFITQGDPPAPAYGRTDAQGVAKMKTYIEGDGAVTGTHKVTIIKSETVGGAPAVDQDSPDYDPEAAYAPSTVKHHIPQKYGSPATSGLTVDVKDGGPNEVKFDLMD
jgi:hypothetical protein